MEVNKEIIINDIIEAVKFFGNIDVDYEFIEKRIANIDFNDNKIAHFGINKLAKEIVSELTVP